MTEATVEYPLSPMQKGMLFHQLFEPESGADIEQMVMRFGEEVDVACLRDAWAAAADRHEVLRTSFVSAGDSEPRQRVHPVAPMEIVEIDHSAYTGAQAEARLREFLGADRRRGFDPERAPLSRLTVFRRRGEASVVVWSFHHIILDGRSFPIVLTDVFAAYDARRAGEPIQLDASVPYRAFIDHLATLDTGAADAYWRKTLAGFTAPTPLAVERIGGVGSDATGFGEISVAVDGPTTKALLRLADDVGVTLNTTLQGAWALLLSIYANDDDVVFGATRSGRYGTIDGADSMAGLFINTLPMRVSVAHSASLASWLREIRAQHLALRDYEHTPLVDVQAVSEIRSGTRLFDSILVFESYQLDPMMRQRTGTGDRVAYELLEQTNHPLLLSVYGGDELDLRLEYDRSLFDPSTAERLAGHVVNLLRAMVEHADGRVGDLDCLDPAETELITSTWNDRGPEHRPDDLVARWRERVRRTPDRPAVVGPGGPVSFVELDARSDAIARQLLDLGSGPGGVVGILLRRSVDATAAMLGVLKSGAAYLPLDPGYPAERLQHMVVDSGAGVVITDSTHAASTDAGGSDAGGSNAETYALSGLVEGQPSLRLLVVDQLAPDEAVQPPVVEVGPDSPAYIIYTSGSTGTPKGVVVSHRALVHHADGVIDAYGLGPEDRVLQFAALSFDVAAEELYPTWLAGGSVVLRTDEAATSFDELHRLIDAARITVLNLPAAYWSAWVEHLASSAGLVPPTVRLVVTGSEKVSTADHRNWQAIAGSSVRWLNAYGPTEATITASVFDPAGADPPPGAVMPIGRPIGRAAFHILDRRGRPVPIGVAGELHIGGPGLALGYHERPALTAERFVTADLPGRTGRRLYRTGDLARWLPDGNVEFLGRLDDQVKVRGFRIELGEIEAALADLDEIAHAAVVAQPDTAGNDQLIAHVVAAPGAVEQPVDTLRTALEKRLPGYMVPVAYRYTTSLPLGPSGKLDRTALPTVEVAGPVGRSVGPRTPLERKLAEVWSTVLGTDDFGIHDNFFDVGGNSLSAIRLFSAVRSLTGERLQLPELFAAPSIAELAMLLGESERDAPSASEAGDGRPSWVVPVKASGSRPPLFHLGGASVLRALAGHLHEDQPLYALLEQDFDADHFYTSVDAIVPHCIEGLRAVQPAGPYLIAGLCFGGVVALEMTRQLVADGDEVLLTVMIDSFAPGAVDTTAKPPDPTPATPPAGGDGLALARRRYHPTRLARKAREQLWRATWGPLHEAYRRAGRPMPPWLRDVEEANTIAAGAYRARPYDGDVTLFRATDNSDELDGGPTNGWAPLIGGELFVTDIVGGHVSMYQEPNVVGLADALTARIDHVLGGRDGRHA